MPASASSGSATSLAGMKRKRPGETKYYAVRIGKVPGIYSTYAECLEQVKGFKGAQFKSFTDPNEAQRFIDHGLAAVQSGPRKYYAVKVGRKPGIYFSWPEAEEQIKGAQGPKYKSFITMEEAEAYMSDNIQSSPIAPRSSSASRQENGTSRRRSDAPMVDELEHQFPPGTGPLPETATDGFDHRLKLNPQTGGIEYKTPSARRAVKMQAHGTTADSWLEIFTDGSSVSNGQLGARAGFGVYFGSEDPRNVSERLQGGRQTNQRAELTAIQRALQIAPLDRHVRIWTDSQYSIDCVTKWVQNWERNNWVTYDGKPVENKDIVKVILARIRERMSVRSVTDFQWVKGHAGVPGNTEADRLAVMGSHKARMDAVDAGDNV